MSARSTTFAIFALAGGLGHGAGCLACNDIGCAGGLEWTATAQDDSPLPPGAYDVEISLDGTVYALQCTVAESTADSSCTAPQRTSGTGDHSISWSLEQAGDEWDPEAPIGGLRMMAVDTTGSAADGSYSENRGPQAVTIAVTTSGQPWLTADYDIQYVRDEAYRGDERCGFCDELEIRSETWTPASAD